MAGRSSTRWTIALGFALGGFFDGILLHQILQWHHLLSLVPAVGSLRAQVLWDGYFHALMYCIALAALWGLWRARSQLDEEPWRAVGGAVLVGLGAWHVVDAVLSHWLLGIHRIILDSPDPLLWDLAWFIAFGLLPLVAGWQLLRGARPSAPGSASGTTALLPLGLVTAGLAAWSLQPSPGQKFTAMAFAPGVRPTAVMEALAANDARLVWSDLGMSVIIADVPKGRGLNFYRHGALLVSGAGLPAGCLGWSRA